MPAHTPYQPYGTGIFRRRLAVWNEEAAQGELTISELIDDFHHFRARIHHDAGVIIGISGEAPRYPWTTCTGAFRALDDLIGKPLERSYRGASRHTVLNTHCSHLFDAACLAISRAARGAGPVVYEIAVPDRIDQRTRPTLDRDGVRLFEWELDEFTILSPPPFAGVSSYGGFGDWAESTLEPDLAEAAILMQRACVISGGRLYDIDRQKSADVVEPKPMGKCHTYTPGRVHTAQRMVGSIRNLTHESDIVAASLAPAKRD